MAGLFAAVLLLLAVFLILLVLVQRGRGGGLAGALGGVGGSSAFGAKAGDVFTKITIVTAAIWIAVCVASVYWANHRTDRLGGAGSLLDGMPASNSTDAAPADQGAAARPSTETTAPPAGTSAPATGTTAPASPASGQ